MTAPAPVLIVTHSADFYTIDLVRDALAKRGATVLRFDTDRFPSQAQVSVRAGGAGSSATFHHGAGNIDSRDVRAVWLRNLWEPHLPAELDPAFVEACRAESLAALDGLWDALGHARWINPPVALQLARNKLRQLRCAREAGLEVPRTLLTNDPAEARAFHRSLGGDVVAKMLTPLSRGMGGDGAFVYTSRVSEDDLAAAGDLRHSPMLFQERIAKQRELRAIAVAGEWFVAGLDASGSEASATDWRRGDPEEVHWAADELPAADLARLDSLLGSLGLVYGAVDLIRTPEGRIVFLEVNPGGEWGMLERDLGFPISEALARALLQP
jgi:glutathione synthase/RimK-type ligase-like ATP-grasp enzyme